MFSLLALNGVLAFLGWRLRTVTGAGALAGFVVGAAVVLSLGGPGYAVLLLYFALGALVTRMGWTRKRALGIAEAQGGARGPRQVAANGGPPVLFCVLAGLLPVSWGAPAAAAFVGSLATAAADTVSSEVGKSLGGTVRRLPGLSRAPAGTPGGVSFAGSAAGLLASVVICGVAAGGGLIPPEWFLPVAAAGFLAAFLEGLLSPLEARGTLDNDGVNAVSVLAGGLLAFGWGWISGGGGAG
ncbi:MAG: DUF92 domain-containing protein [Acidobacteria bacterium]|nr:DUF92 domain-containing protein [Acidobacteriota bacterium]MYA47265.1 DUF92 domain-containing protein [Acidobacteriota bacterium]MYI39657.1 DUF92 domain-containing protein [Acidobacteriota bacterium]